MIKPTVGRVVWFWPSLQFLDHRYRNGDPFKFFTFTPQPCAAIISYVHSDYIVNLSVFDHEGRQHLVTSCPLHHETGEGSPTSESYCEWMPYQKGQAAKTEALEKKLSEG